jgi:hypothetical protein
MMAGLVLAASRSAIYKQGLRAKESFQRWAEYLEPAWFVSIAVVQVM